MVSGYSGAEGIGFLIQWCFMEFSENQSVFAGVFDCAYFQWHLTKSCNGQLDPQHHD
jgi:hypothetical protein